MSISLMFRFTVGLVVVLLGSQAIAGGFDYSDQGIDLLLKPGNSVEAGYKYVKPSRNFSNIRRTGISQQASENGNFVEDLHIPHFRLKYDINKSLGCLLAYRFPYGTDQDHGTSWEGRYYATTTDLDVQSLGVDCAYARPLSAESRLLYIGGLRIERADVELGSQASSAAVTRGANLAGGDSSVSNELDSTEIGYTLGFAYQIPKKGVSISVVYNSAIDHDYRGTQRLRVPAGVLGASGAVLERPISLQVTNPQSLQINASMGVAPGWAALAIARWVDWSVLDEIAIKNEQTGAVSSAGVGWGDTWTVGLGAAHRLRKTLGIYGVAFFDEDASNDRVRGARTSVADGVGLTLGLNAALSKQSYIKASITAKRLSSTNTEGYLPTQTSGASDPLAGANFTATTEASTVYALKLIAGRRF
ncbi:MAG: OmpP1/FadL family transporter [Arenicella sp.]